MGQIENLLIDMTAGRIASATLACGGWLGLGENLALVPWEALTCTQRTDRVTLNVDTEKLRPPAGRGAYRYGGQIDTATANGRLIYRVGESRAEVSDA